jgi:hypothetical protein
MTIRRLSPLLALLLITGCGRQAVVTTDAIPLRRVVVYRNGVAYFERAGHVEEDEVRFKMKESEVGDFLATLAVIEKGGSSVRSAAFPLKAPEEEEDDRDDKTKPRPKTADEKRGLKKVVLALDGKAHDLEIGYVAASPVWRPSYRLVVEPNGQAYLQAWGIVQNLSGEDWKNVRLSLVAGAPLAFEAQLGEPVIPQRPIVTDQGEVIAAVPKGETSLEQERDRDHDGIPDSLDKCPDEQETFNGVDDGDGCPDKGRVVLADQDEEDAPKAARAERRQDEKRDVAKKAPRGGAATGSTRGPSGGPMAPPPAQDAPAAPAAVRREPPKSAAPRNLRSLAAVAVESGTTRYDLPQPVTIPDRSSTMVMLLSKQVPGEAMFLFAPDGGVPDSTTHPFRVVRFANKTPGVLERGPIAVFERGSFLGQGMVDPLPAGATATVPFALERAIAVDLEHKSEELGERVSKIENGALTIERDSVRLTKYRMRNGADAEVKLLVRHLRVGGSRLHQPPAETEDNVGAQTALVPARIKPRATAELVVDERTAVTRAEDWFSLVADRAVKTYLADSRSDRAAVAKLTSAWVVRKDIVEKSESRGKLAQEEHTLREQTNETRASLRAIEKNKAADQLRARLTARLAENSARLDEVGKRLVETDAKLAELRIQFREHLRDLKVTLPPAPIR